MKKNKNNKAEKEKETESSELEDNDLVCSRCYEFRDDGVCPNCGDVYVADEK